MAELPGGIEATTLLRRLGEPQVSEPAVMCRGEIGCVRVVSMAASAQILVAKRTDVCTLRPG